MFVSKVEALSEKNVKFFKMAGISNPAIEHDAKTRGIILHIVEQIKSQGVFDRFRRDCLEELDSKVVCYKND